MLLAALWAIVLVPAGSAAAAEDKALGRPATASSVEDQSGGSCAFRICTPDKANDGRADTRWGSAFDEDEYWQVDLGGPRLVDTVRVDWQNAYPQTYEISTSLDGVSFTLAGAGALELGHELERYHQPVETKFVQRRARYVRVTGLVRATIWGFSIWSVNVFGASDPVPPPAPSPTPRTPTPAPGGSPPALISIASASRVRLAGRVVGSRTIIRLLSVRAPSGAIVRVRCRGGGCPRKVRTRRGSARFRELRGVLKAGALLEVFVTQRNTYGKYTRFRFRRAAPPRRVDRCVAHGSRTPIACPVT